MSGSTLSADSASVSIYDGTSTQPIATVPVQSDGTWSAQITLAPGENDLVARDADRAGNVGTTSTLMLTLASPPAQSSTSGVAVDGYIAGATVFADANQNGVLDPGEASTTTNSVGAFTLQNGSGPIVLVGGTDVSTGLANKLTLKAPAGSTVVTPLTTLISQVATLNGGNVAAAQAAVTTAFGIPAATNLLALDPEAAALGGQSAGTAAFVAGSLVQNTVVLLAAGGSQSGFGALASAISATTGGLDLTNVTTLAQVSAAAGLSTTAASAVTALAQSSNATLLGKVSSAQSPAALFALVTASNSTAQGQTSAALSAALSSGDPSLLSNVVSSYSGAALNSLVTAALGSVVLPDGSRGAAAVAPTGSGSATGTPTNSAPMPPMITFGPTVGASDPNTAALTGTVSDASGVKSVEIFEGTTDLGSATIDSSSGTWAFTDTFAPGFHTGFTALATGNEGVAASAPSNYDLTTGVTGAPYAAYQDSYDPGTGVYEGQTFFRRNGGLEMHTQYSPTPDGGSTVLSSGGSAFAKTPYFAIIDTYDAASQPVEEDVYYKDGHQTVQGLKPGQTLDSISNDTFYSKGGRNSFVFTPHFGADTITSFVLGGQNHDTISLPDSAASKLGSILNHATMDGQGDTTLHLDGQDSITIQGVSVAELKQHKQDFTFHA